MVSSVHIGFSYPGAWCVFAHKISGVEVFLASVLGFIGCAEATAKDLSGFAVADGCPVSDQVRIDNVNVAITGPGDLLALPAPR